MAPVFAVLSFPLSLTLFPAHAKKHVAASNDVADSSVIV